MSARCFCGPESRPGSSFGAAARLELPGDPTPLVVGPLPRLGLPAISLALRGLYLALVLPTCDAVLVPQSEVIPFRKDSSKDVIDESVPGRRIDHVAVVPVFSVHVVAPLFHVEHFQIGAVQ